MSNLVLKLALIVGFALTATATNAAAQDRKCRAEINATGGGAIRESRAKEKAEDAWRQQAVANHGIFYGESKEANEGKGVLVERCAKSLLGLTICQARGRPCLVAKADFPNEIACTSNDSKNCNSTVKWVQTRLKDKGVNIYVDGSAGKGTEAAIRKFKKDNKLGDNAEIDDKLIEALKG